MPSGVGRSGVRSLARRFKPPTPAEASGTRATAVRTETSCMIAVVVVAVVAVVVFAVVVVEVCECKAVE